MTSNLSELSVSQLKRAVQIKEQIEKLESELSSLLGSSSSRQAAPTKGGMSEATKAKLRAAAKARWAKVNSGKSAGSKAAAPKKSKMSAAARAKISAAAKARWAKAKAAGKKGL
jgi:hypothetical protein